MQRIILVGLAGLAGTLVRFWLSGRIDERWGGLFPIGTLFVNLLGCLLVGFLFHSLQERFLVDPMIRTTVLVGFLGGFTTFSSYGVQTFNLLRDGEMALAGLNITLSNVGGLFCVWAGYALSRSL